MHTGYTLCSLFHMYRCNAVCIWVMYLWLYFPIDWRRLISWDRKTSECIDGVLQKRLQSQRTGERWQTKQSAERSNQGDRQNWQLRFPKRKSVICTSKMDLKPLQTESDKDYLNVVKICGLDETHSSGGKLYFFFLLVPVFFILWTLNDGA